MDPLSITASAIALGGFAATIGKAVKTLKSLGKVPDEFCSLLNELTMLQLVARGLDNFPATASTAELDILRQDLAQTVRELQDLVSRFETSSKGLDGHGRHTISRIQWTRERSNIESLREQARRTRDYVTPYLATANMSESFDQSSRLLEVQGIIRLSSDNLLASVDEGARNTESRLCRIENRLESIISLQAEAPYYQKVREVGDQQQASHLAEKFDVSHTTTDRKDSILCLQAVLRCRLTCRCRCHKSTNLQANSYLRSVVGAFFLSYNAAATFGSGACNYAKCNGSSTPKVQFSYYLPTWVASCAVQFSASWGSLQDRGAKLSFRVPRVIRSDDRIWPAIAIGDIKDIQALFSQKRNFPTDVEEGTGRTLISYAVAQGQCDLIKLLLQEGSDVSMTFTTGLSAESRAKRRLLTGGCGDDEARFVYERVVEVGGNDHFSTGIHDSILGINDIVIDKAIEMEPESLNSLDSMGNTPLHWAARLGNTPALNALLQANASASTPNSWRSTPLHVAARYGNISAVQRLLDAGGDPNARDVDGQTPLHEALTDPLDSYPDSTDIVKLLLRYGGGPNLADTVSKRSPLNYYVHRLRCYSERVKRNVDLLLMAGADMNQADKWGQTPLLNCSNVHNFSKSRLFRLLQSRGARLDAADVHKQSDLHRERILEDSVELWRVWTGEDEKELGTGIK